jgi:hypothetical protein
MVRATAKSRRAKASPEEATHTAVSIMQTQDRLLQASVSVAIPIVRNSLFVTHRLAALEESSTSCDEEIGDLDLWLPCESAKAAVFPSCSLSAAAMAKNLLINPACSDAALSVAVVQPSICVPFN